MKPRIPARIAWDAGIVIVAVGLLAHFVYRPWQLTWGATDQEIAGAMAGDSVVAQPSFIATRAVTINAEPEEIWPWIIQIGYQRAGFYSWDFLDNDRVASAETIVPEYQDLQEGDLVPLDEDTDAVVDALSPNRHLVLVFLPDSAATWVWGLYPADHGGTRMVVRLRVHMDDRMSRLLFEYFEIIMMRRHILGIKRRAESMVRSGQLSVSAD